MRRRQQQQVVFLCSPMFEEGGGGSYVGHPLEVGLLEWCSLFLYTHTYPLAVGIFFRRRRRQSWVLFFNNPPGLIPLYMVVHVPCFMLYIQITKRTEGWNNKKKKKRGASGRNGGTGLLLFRSSGAHLDIRVSSSFSKIECNVSQSMSRKCLSYRWCRPNSSEIQIFFLWISIDGSKLNATLFFCRILRTLSVWFAYHWNTQPTRSWPKLSCKIVMDCILKMRIYFAFFFGGGVSFSVRKNKWQRNPPEAPSKPLLSHPLWKRKALLAKERVFVKDSEYTHTLKERERQQMETETLSRCANEKFAFNDDGSIPNSTNLFWFFASPTLIILPNPSKKKETKIYRRPCNGFERSQ